MDPNKVADFLKDEYILLQTLYEDMDGKALTIKNWSITVALAIIGASILVGNRDLLWLAAAAAFVFWYLEAYWRGLSHFFAVRIQEIEAAIRNNTLGTEMPLQVYSTWSKEYARTKDQTFRYMLKRASILPHAVIPIFALALYWMLA